MSPQQCREALATYYPDSLVPERAKQVLSALKKYEPQCRGSGYLELLKANAYLVVGDVPEAKRWVAAGLAVPDFDQTPLYEVQFGINVRLQRNADNLALAEQLIAKQPDDAIGYYLKGKYFAKIGDARDAIENLERSKAMGDENAKYSADKLLIPAYWELNRIPDVAATFDDAERVKPHLIYGDWELSRLGAISHFLAGDKERAGAILQRQLELHPETRSDKFVSQLISDLAKEGVMITPSVRTN